MLNIIQERSDRLCETGVAVVFQDGPDLSCPDLIGGDPATRQQIARAVRASGFMGGNGEVLSIPAPVGTDLDMLILVGSRGADGPLAFRKLGAAVAVMPQVLAAGAISLFAATGCTDVVRGLALRSYSFDRYKRKQPILDTVRLCGGPGVEARILAEIAAETAAIHFARDLINEPANVLTPQEMAARLAREAGQTGIADEGD